MKEKYEIKFWKDWLEADSIKKRKLIEKLSIIKDIGNIEKIPKRVRKHIFVSSLNSFFEDLGNAVYTKIRLENKKKKDKLKKF